MFEEKERLLANEAELTSSMLANGLTSLRKANVYNKGLYYQAFFSLSIGIERLLKIILITRYRCEHNGEFSTDIDLKKMSHNLKLLFEDTGIEFEKNSIHQDIVYFLSDFAQNARYYNIDVIVDRNNKFYDPLCEWSRIAKRIVDSGKKGKTINNKQELARVIDEFALFNLYDLQGKNITGALDILDMYEFQETIQSYSVHYVFEIITKGVEEIRKLERKKYLMPVLSEFFPLYHKNWKPYEIRRKKDWTRIF